MLKDALDYLSGLVRQSEAPRPIATGDPRRLSHFIGGQIVHTALTAPPRQHKPATLDDVISLASRFTEAPVEPGAMPVIWIGPERVVVVLDDCRHRCETATLDLSHSTPWLRLSAIGAKLRGEPLEHKAFLRLLRIELAGCLAPIDLYDKVKRVTFENGQTVTANVSRNKAESMGRAINAAVSGEGEIPEEVTLAVPVYSTPGETARYPVRCSVEVEPLSGTFALAPLPDELAKVQALALTAIESRLLGSVACPVYFGQP